MKKCNRCLEEKELDSFNKDKTKDDGHMNICKSCRGKKHIDNKEYNNLKSREYYINNRDTLLEKKKKYTEDNKDFVKSIWKKYRKENKDKMNKNRREYNIRKRKSDPLYKLRENIRSLIIISVKKQGYSKKSKTFDILGCTLEEFKIHLENQFVDGMNWNNFGKWHMDHIKPISLAKNEDEVYKLNHYTNFQPLWGIDNLSKGNRYIS